MRRKDLPVEENYTGARVQTVVSAWRPKGKMSIGEHFCVRYGTAACPHNGICPSPGYCEMFLFKASTVPEAEALIIQDANRYQPVAA